MDGMTKREYQITDQNEILDILNRSLIVHLGLVDGDEPYVVPLNYGYTMEENGALTIFVHGAVRGRKLDVMRRNPKVFLEMSCDVQPFDGTLPCQYGTAYRSLMGRGVATILESPEEKMAALSCLMKTQTGKDFTFNERLVSIVSVVRIDVAEYTAKLRPMPKTMG